MRASTCAVLPCNSRLILLVLIFAGLILTIIFCVSVDLMAQDGSTSLQGIIEDATGARIASAAITVSDPSRGLQLHTVTNAEGTFNFGMLPPGRYDVTASAPALSCWSAELRWCNYDWRRQLQHKPSQCRPRPRPSKRRPGISPAWCPSARFRICHSTGDGTRTLPFCLRM